MRKYVRAIITGVTVGAVGLGSAWGAAVVINPGWISRTSPATSARVASSDAAGAAEAAAAARLALATTAEGGAVAAPAGPRLAGGWYLAGTASRTLVPPAEQWVQGTECKKSNAPEQLYTPFTPEGCLITFDMLWAQGYDADNPIMVRSSALSNGVDTIVFSVLDVVGYMASYPADLCTDCGIAQITQKVGSQLGVPEANLIVSSSHTHAAPTTIGKGGAWYYRFVRDQVAASITEAVGNLTANPPVRLETGFTQAKAYNTDRRIVNRAVPDYELGWLRAYVPGVENDGRGRTIASFGNFAVHPTVRTANARLHSGIVGPFTRQLEQRLGGAALFMPGAIGDQKVDRDFGINGIGGGLADAIADSVAKGGYVLQSNDIKVARTGVQVPVENQFFVGALAVGYAVRDSAAPFGGGPHTAIASNSSASRPVCQQSGVQHIVTPVSAVRLGAQPPGGKQVIGTEHKRAVETDNVVLVQAPGELFASFGLITKDYLSRSRNVFIQGLTNDTIGYMIPANQYDVFASQGQGLVGNATGTSNYEETLSLGNCTGELVQNAMLAMGQSLGVMGEGEGP